jgi:predicted GNAT superfamily acetyltransferase
MLISMVYPHLGCRAAFPTDRLVAEWRLDTSYVHATLEGRATNLAEIASRIQVPAAVYAWKASQAERDRALAVQLQNRRMFLGAFSQGLAVLAFIRDAEGNGTYLLGDPAQLELPP